MAKSRKVARSSAPKYNPMKSSVIQIGIVIIVIAAIALAYYAGGMMR